MYIQNISVYQFEYANHENHRQECPIIMSFEYDFESNDEFEFLDCLKGTGALNLNSRVVIKFECWSTRNVNTIINSCHDVI